MTTEHPAALGYRAVGEWARNAACFTAWPAHAYAWGEFLDAAQREFVGFCEALLAEPDNEPLELLVPDADAEADARAALSRFGARVRYRKLQVGDVWLRDTAPVFVRGERGLASVRFNFNGWGGKYAYLGDATLAARLQQQLGLPAFACELTTEGGALELDGEGTCLTTESCLLGANRGAPSREHVERALGQAFGVERVLWLEGGLAGDHTDGHIDNLARFVAPGKVVHLRPSDGDPNADTLRAIETSLAGFSDARGRTLALHALPSPGAVLDAEGQPMAASYMNFYLANMSVIVPTFGTPHDEAALSALAAVFPDRRVVGRRANAILEGGGGTFHCMTRQQPEAAP
jgi:agmatine deiminase